MKLILQFIDPVLHVIKKHGVPLFEIVASSLNSFFGDPDESRR
jgi:hypothetical protein